MNKVPVLPKYTDSALLQSLLDCRGSKQACWSLQWVDGWFQMCRVDPEAAEHVLPFGSRGGVRLVELPEDEGPELGRLLRAHQRLRRLDAAVHLRHHDAHHRQPRRARVGYHAVLHAVKQPVCHDLHATKRSN